MDGLLNFLQDYVSPRYDIFPMRWKIMKIFMA